MGLDDYQGSGILTLLLTIGEFVLMLVFVALILTLFPRERLTAVYADGTRCEVALPGGRGSLPLKP